MFRFLDNIGEYFPGLTLENPLSGFLFVYSVYHWMKPQTARLCDRARKILLTIIDSYVEELE